MTGAASKSGGNTDSPLLAPDALTSPLGDRTDVLPSPDVHTVSSGLL